MENNKFWFLMSPYMSLDGNQSSPFTAFSIEFCIPNCLNVGCGKSGLESQMLILNFIWKTDIPKFKFKNMLISIT